MRNEVIRIGAWSDLEKRLKLMYVTILVSCLGLLPLVGLIFYGRAPVITVAVLAGGAIGGLMAWLLIAFLSPVYRGVHQLFVQGLEPERAARAFDIAMAPEGGSGPVRNLRTGISVSMKSIAQYGVWLTAFTIGSVNLGNRSKAEEIERRISDEVGKIAAGRGE